MKGGKWDRMVGESIFTLHSKLPSTRPAFSYTSCIDPKSCTYNVAGSVITKILNQATLYPRYLYSRTMYCHK